MVVVGMAAIALASAASGSGRYGDTLLAREMKLHPGLAYAAVDLDSPQAAHFEAGAVPTAADRNVLQLDDRLGNRIGMLTLGFPNRAPKTAAAAIAADLSRHIYARAVLGEPDPFAADAYRSRSGQALVERELKREPQLVTIALHVALPGGKNQIIASNFGRIGKAADADDSHVIADKAILQEMTNAGRRLAVELPLLDRAGRTIGALSTSFLIGPGGREEAYRSALRVQRDVSRAIPRLESLAQ
jgi:hypothetical protein